MRSGGLIASAVSFDPRAARLLGLGALFLVLASLASATHAAESGPVESGPVESGPAESGPAESGPAESGQATAASASSADPAWGDDPPADDAVHGSELDLAWFGAGSSIDGRAERLERRALELGAGDVEHAARALIAPRAPGIPMRNARLATRLAPHLPIVHIVEARVLWEQQRRGEALTALIRGVRAIPEHLEGSLWLAGSLLSMFVAVALVGSLGFVFAVAFTALTHAAHDLGDLFTDQMPGFARAALLSSLLLLPILLGEGLIGFALGLFALGFVYGTRAHRLSLALAAVLLVLAMYPLARSAGIALGALSADPVAEASHAVVQSLETSLDVELLERAAPTDVLAERTLAVLARRSGRLDEAHARYAALLELSADDPVVSTNLANLWFRSGRSQEAIALYEAAVGKMDSATLLFNLSQAYASEFRMEDFESTMALAQMMAPDRTAALSRLGDARFVADLPLPVSLIRERMVEVAAGEEFQAALVHAVAPGMLGAGWSATAAGFTLVVLIALWFGRRYEHSSRCSRCGRRICIRCDGTYWNNEVCDACHHLFHLPETTDHGLRTERLSRLHSREVRVDRLAFATSLLIPGAAGLLARRPDHALIGMLLFVLAAVLLIWRNGVVPDPLAIGGIGPVAFVAAGMMASLGYVLMVLAGVLIRRRQ